jgi:serine/threonine protein kinase
MATQLIPHVSGDSLNLIEQLLAYNPDERLSARQALKHPYFKELREAEKVGGHNICGAGGALASSFGIPVRALLP